MYICICQQITDSHIKKIIAEDQIKSMEELASLLGIGESCGTCIIDAEKILKDCLEANTINENNLK